MNHSKPIVTWTSQALAAAICVLAAPPPAPAQDAAKLAPPAPVIWSIVPSGAQRGTTALVTVRGTGLDSAKAVRVEAEGVNVSLVPPQNGKPANARRINIRMEIAPDAPLGMHELRIITEGGASNVARFCISPYAEVTEREPNDLDALSYAVPQLPVVINGALDKTEDRDSFRFRAKKGQRIIMDLVGRRLQPYVARQRPGWLEAVLTVREFHSPQEEAATEPTLLVRRQRDLAYAHDYGGRQDPLLVFDVPRDGEYVVTVHDELYRGRPQFNYRLTIGEIPFVLSCLPAGGVAGSAARIGIEGINLGRINQLTVNVPKAARGDVFLARVENGLGISPAVPLHIGHDPECLEQEPNQDRNTAQPISVPCTVNGRIEREGDRDYFKFTARKGDRWVIETVNELIGSPVDAAIDVYTAAGKRLQTNDDSNRSLDARIDFTAPADGEYWIRLRDTTGSAGIRHVYRLLVRPPRPNFRVTVSPDNPRVSAGGATALRVQLQRLDGFSGPVRVVAEGLPPGAQASPIEFQGTVTEQMLVIHTPADAKPGSTAISVTAQAERNGTQQIETGVPAEPLRYVNEWRYVPVSDLVLSVVPAAPFGIAFQAGTATVSSGETIVVPVKIHRSAQFTAPLRLTLAGLPPRTAAPPVEVPEGATEAAVEIRCYSNAPENTSSVVLVATTSAGGRTLSEYSQPLLLTVAPPPKPAKPAKKTK